MIMVGVFNKSKFELMHYSDLKRLISWSNSAILFLLAVVSISGFKLVTTSWFESSHWNLGYLVVFMVSAAIIFALIEGRPDSDHLKALWLQADKALLEEE